MIIRILIKPYIWWMLSIYFGIDKCNCKCHLSLKDATQIFRSFWAHLRSDMRKNFHILFGLVPFQDTYLGTFSLTWQSYASDNGHLDILCLKIPASLYRVSRNHQNVTQARNTMAKPFSVSLLLILSCSISRFYWHRGTKWWQGTNFLSQNQRLSLLCHEGDTWVKSRPNTKYLIYLCLEFSFLTHHMVSE